jgi:MbtH protein
VSVHVTNPFEDETAPCFALVNDEGQYSLWPAFAPVPPGWRVAFGEDTRQACLEHVERNWTDMRPKSLIRAMREDGSGGVG